MTPVLHAKALQVCIMYFTEVASPDHLLSFTFGSSGGNTIGKGEGLHRDKKSQNMALHVTVHAVACVCLDAQHGPYQ